MAPTNAAESARKKLFSSIQTKLILLLCILLLPTLAIQVYVYNERFQTRRTEELQANLEVARAVAKSFEVYVSDIMHIELAVGLAFSYSETVSEHNHILAKFQADNPTIANALWADPQGLVIAAGTRESIGLSIADRTYFQRIIASQEWTLSELVLGKATGKACFHVSRGIRDEQGRLLGLVVAAIDPCLLDDILEIHRAKGGSISIVDNKGMLVYRYPHIDQTWEQRNWLNSLPQIEKALSGEEIAWIGKTVYTDKMRIMANVPVKNLGWSAGADRGTEEALGSIRTALLTQTLILILITFAAFGTALVFSRRISASIGKLRDQALALGRGEAPDTPLLATGTAELDDLAVSFGQMAENIQNRESERNRAEGRLASDLAALGRIHELSGRFLDSGGLNPLLQDIMNAAAIIVNAEMGTLHLLEGNTLRIVASFGHQQPFLDCFASSAENRASACGKAMTCRERVVVPDVETSSLFVGTSSLPILRDAGVRAVQSTPMIGRSGMLLGILTTQWKVQHIPDEHDLRRIDLLVRQAADLIEHAKAEEELCKSRNDLELRVKERTAELAKLNQELLTEIAERELVEKTVKAERQRLFDVFETIPAMVRLLTSDYRIAFANRSFRAKFGESNSLYCYEYCFGRSEPCEFCECNRVLETGEPHQWEVTCPDGSIVTMYDFLFADVDGAPMILEMGIDITERREAERKLREIPSMLIAAQEEERKRLASELHDSIGQTLAALKFRIEHILAEFRKGKAAEATATAEEFIPTLQRAIDETRTIYMGLRPQILEDFGVVAALSWYRDELLKLYPQQHVEIAVRAEESQIPGDLNVPIFRVAQEALNNASKHSRAEWVDLSLALDGNGIELVISDDGVGMDLDQILQTSMARSLGLTSMRERVEMFGGRFSIQSTPGIGTTVRACWPIS